MVKFWQRCSLSNRNTRSTFEDCYMWTGPLWKVTLRRQDDLLTWSHVRLIPTKSAESSVARRVWLEIGLRPTWLDLVKLEMKLQEAHFAVKFSGAEAQQMLRRTWLLHAPSAISSKCQWVGSQVARAAGTVGHLPGYHRTPSRHKGTPSWHCTDTAMHYTALILLTFISLNVFVHVFLLFLYFFKTTIFLFVMTWNSLEWLGIVRVGLSIVRIRLGIVRIGLRIVRVQIGIFCVQLGLSLENWISLEFLGFVRTSWV